jgi:hypothetical protein
MESGLNSSPYMAISNLNKLGNIIVGNEPRFDLLAVNIPIHGRCYTWHDLDCRNDFIQLILLAEANWHSRREVAILFKVVK